MLRVGLFEWVSFSYANVAERAPVALGEEQNRTFCGLTKPPLPEAPWNAELAAFLHSEQRALGRKKLETHLPSTCSSHSS